MRAIDVARAALCEAGRPDLAAIAVWVHIDDAAAIEVRCSVGMVLPIVADVGPLLDGLHIRVTGAGIAWLAEPIDGGGWKHTEIALPPGAQPGMRAIQLRKANR